MTFDGLLPPSISHFLAAISSRDRYMSPGELDEVIGRWAGSGVEIVPIGRSSQGRPLRVAVFGTGPKTMFAWGFPHPDEPVGATALAEFGDGILRGALHGLAGWRVCLMLCADPDNAVLNDAWLQSTPDLSQMCASAWRPRKSWLEVDYGFPLDWGPWTSTPTAGTIRLAPSPLSESLALAAAFRLFKPDLVCAMHNAHVGGDYTFLLEGEPAAVLDDLLLLPAVCGQPRHLGEKIDSGRRFRRNAPDLLHEPRLSDELSWLRRRPWFSENDRYFDRFSAAQHLEATLPGTQFACPEVGLFRCESFADTSPVEEFERCLVSVEDRPSRRRYRLTRIKVDGQWLIAEQVRADDKSLQRAVERELPLSRAMLGTRAIFRRRAAFANADVIWQRLTAAEVPLVPHPYLVERQGITVPGAYVGDRALRLFRGRSDFHRPASVAEAACFRYRWPIETAVALGNFASFLAAQDARISAISNARRELAALQHAEVAVADGVFRADVAPALRSQLARVCRLMLARS